MDISSQIIAELRAEIVDLKKRVSTLEEKFNNKEDEIKNVNLNGCVDLQDVSKVSLFCVFEPNASSNHEDACKNVHEPQDSHSVSPVCVSVCSHTEQRSKSALYPQISSVCSVFKKEPDPMEIPETAGLNDINTMAPSRESERPHEVPLNLDCHEALQTPLKNCSVQLVDCGNTFKQVTKSAKASKKFKCRQSSRVKMMPPSKRLKHPLDCSLCIKTTLQTNKSNHTTEKIYQCSQCEQKFNYFQTYIKHKKLHKRKQLRQNRDKKIIEKKQLRQNRDKKIIEKKQLRQNRDKKINEKKQLLQNRDKKINEKKQLRQNGDKKIKEKKQLRQNRDKKIKEKKQLRQNGDKKIKEKKQLRQNRDKNIKEKKQLRQNRDKNINKKKQLHQNLDKSEDTEMQIMEMSYPCTLCGKIHTYLRSTKGHMKVHSGEKPYECIYCGLGFTYPQNHMNHLKKHTGEKPYECTYCGTQFTLDLCLKEHVKMHTG